MSSPPLRPGVLGSGAPAAAQPGVNALLMHYPALHSRGPLPPRNPKRSGMSPPISQMAHAPLPHHLAPKPHGAPLPAPGGLPGTIVRVGPAGGDAAQAHLRAGHSPGELVEAAANSLAQAAMVHGRLDPSQFAEWVRHRLHFLAHIPHATELFGTVEAAECTIQAITSRAGAPHGHQLRPAPAAPRPGARFAVQQNDLMPVASSATSYASRSNPLLPR